jgi:hypothetical protein
MPGYYFCSWNPKTKSSGDFVGFGFNDLFECQSVRVDLEDAVEHDDPEFTNDVPPDPKAVKALCTFDPEAWILTQDDPDFTCEDAGDFGSTGYATPATVKRWADAMKRLEKSVRPSKRATWDKVAAIFAKLAADKLGLHCSPDE